MAELKDSNRHSTKIGLPISGILLHPQPLGLCNDVISQHLLISKRNIIFLYLDWILVLDLDLDLDLGLD